MDTKSKYVYTNNQAGGIPIKERTKLEVSFMVTNIVLY